MGWFNMSCDERAEYDRDEIRRKERKADELARALKGLQALHVWNCDRCAPGKECDALKRAENTLRYWGYHVAKRHEDGEVR